MKHKYLLQSFDEWNIKKKNIQFSERSQRSGMYFKEGDVWWCSIGLNVGDESFGKGKDFRRPVLIIKKLSADLYIVLSLTTKYKAGTWFSGAVLNNENISVMLHQIKTVDKKRFSIKLGEFSKYDYAKTKEKLKTLLEFF